MRLQTKKVAIPSNQVGNFHRFLPRESEGGEGNVAIPSNQVGNFHPTVIDLTAARRQISRNPFKSGR